MATTYSAQKTMWDQNSPKEMIKTNEQAGRVRIAYASAEAASLAVGPIEMFNLPNGARILSGEVVHDALGGSTTLSVGHAAYVNSSALGKNSVVDANEVGIPITVVIAGAAATGTIELTMLWVLD